MKEQQRTLYFYKSHRHIMSPLLPTYRRNRVPILSLSSFLISLLVASSCIPRAEGYSLLGRITPDAVAFGFDLGQSYGTSVARFENGTTIPLAKIRGSAAYTALMENLISKPTTPHWLSYRGTVGRWLSLFRSLMKILGLAPSYKCAVLSEMVAALKTASEAALQIQIQVEAVAVTAPWMAALDNQLPTDSVINDALLLADLEPWTLWADGEIYLGEVNTILVSEDRSVCKNVWCTGHWMEVEGDIAVVGLVFFISFTNHSLYTSFQRTGCYFNNPLDHSLTSIDPRYGLDKVSQATSPKQYWSELKTHLLSLVKQHKTRGRTYDCQSLFTVLVAGEAANTPEFLDVVHDVVQAILRESWTAEREENGKTGHVELIIPDDLTYGAARGAAFWLQTRMNRTYCAVEGILDQYDIIGDTHVEL
ncbi:hypothetical protein VE01_09064 [Pseudogymnoascus verrucosus]|uniref:Uncharacterized protein n=1 Tax=Pseudogymnoascus verrucosus TaxID=342668 RepID=A0A1B8GAD5_9PEZI|nr:uncharacterized protein VE01_09064 [Pseudogymnoascus verrucosus]OBT92806.2 hypothetical protein VE01_09064 [Pseudogymnoascus verrucosus]